MSLTGVLVVAAAMSEPASHTLLIGHLELRVAQGWVLEEKEGPDFTVYYVRPDWESSSVMGLYLGNHPRSPETPDGSTREPFTLGAAAGVWVLRASAPAGRERFHAEALLKAPFGVEPAHAEHLHVFITAESVEELRSLQALASRLRPSEKGAP